MTELQIESDMRQLAVRLPHRGSNTENERAAAEYIRDRLRTCFPESHIDDFYSPDNLWYLFASYYAEFAVVSLISLWLPTLALAYGAAVFIAYLAEFNGFQVISRFIAQYESQNVVASLLSESPKRQYVIMAHYDSAKTAPFPAAEHPRWRYLRELVIVLAMITVIGACALMAAGAGPESLGAIRAAQWAAVAVLVCAAIYLAYNALASQYAPGANDNASGVAALLQLAEKLGAEPVPGADIYLVATGSNKTWMHGARQFLTTHALDPDNTWFLTIDTVGQGRLAYTTAIGMLQKNAAAKDLVAAAKACAAQVNAGPIRLDTISSDAIVPLIRGYKAMEITSTFAAENQQESRQTIDHGLIQSAAQFAYRILQHLSSRPEDPTSN